MSAPSQIYDVAVRSCKAAVGWGGFAGGCVVWGASVVPATVLLSYFAPSVRDSFNDLTHASLDFYIRTLPFMKVVVDRPAAPDREDGARILTANHQSLLDPIMLMSIERSLSGPAKAYLFRWPGLGAFLRLAGFYQSDANGRDLLESMRRGVEQAVARGSSVLFFPEGTRSRSGEMGRFHRGAFRMAIEYGLPIQPVVIDGIHDILPPGALLVKTAERPEVRVSYLEPIEVKAAPENARRAARELAEEVRDRMSAELVRLRAQRACTESRP